MSNFFDNEIKKEMDRMFNDSIKISAIKVKIRESIYNKFGIYVPISKIDKVLIRNNVRYKSEWVKGKTVRLYRRF